MKVTQSWKGKLEEGKKSPKPELSSPFPIKDAAAHRLCADSAHQCRHSAQDKGSCSQMTRQLRVGEPSTQACSLTAVGRAWACRSGGPTARSPEAADSSEEKEEDGKTNSLDAGLLINHYSFSFSLQDKTLSKWISLFQLHVQSGTQLKPPLIMFWSVSALMGALPKRVTYSNAFRQPGLNEVSLVSLSLKALLH